MQQNDNWNEQNLPDDLIIAKKTVYDFDGFKYSQPLPELESKEYAAYRFNIDSLCICYRIAKKTPTKTGQFVTLWKRNEKNGAITPFDTLDAIDLIIISVRKDDYLGQFIFPKAILLEKGIFSTNIKEGKRAMRVYPPWDKTSSKQAQETQKWQINYFFEISIQNISFIEEFLRDIIEKT